MTRYGMTWILGSLLVAGSAASIPGCSDESPCRYSGGTWCQGNVVYTCSHGDSNFFGSNETLNPLENCAAKGGVCRDVRPAAARCVVPNQMCEPGRRRTCWNGNAHSCFERHLLLEPSKVCSEDAPCTPTASGITVTCGPEPGDAQGGAGGQMNEEGDE